MVSSRSEGHEGGSGRGGARADFIASLGKKVADARNALDATTQNPGASSGRDELRRKLHALGTGARLLKLDSMALTLKEACNVLDRAAQAGVISSDDVGFIAEVLDDLPALAWGDTGVRSQSDSDPPKDPSRVADDPMLAVSVLVVGPEELSEALMHEESQSTLRAFECERADDTESAMVLARIHAPDLVVLSAVVPGGKEFVTGLLEDPLTEPVPVVVVGPFASPETAAAFTALGVARLITENFPLRVVRAICDSVFDDRDEPTIRLTLGEPTLEQLGERLATEIRHALVDSLDRPARTVRVPLGEGTEVLGALWGAIARIQEVITEKTEGGIRYGGGGPEGAIALAPSLRRDVPGNDRAHERRFGAAADVRLDGRRVVVADDDPGVTWFISDLLRTAGCTVYEAMDGKAALNLAFEHSAELVVSDILMPGLDGFGLCRAIRRDVALRDTPVILISWKEDLLQRVRELGASAAGYLRKESDSRAIVARVREVLRPKARLEGRLATDGEVRGRLDGVTVRTLLELLAVKRPNVRVSVRDASFLYEVELRDASPATATRTSSEGAYKSGPRVLAAMLGVGAGRFVVTPAKESVTRTLVGSLAEQLAEPIACARGALAASTGAQTVSVERILIASDDLPEYLHATPEPERSIVQRLASGSSPRRLLLDGDIAPSLLEDVLSDLASRGAIVAVRGDQGKDLLEPAVRHARAVAIGQFERSPSPPRVQEQFRPSGPPRAVGALVRPTPRVPPAPAPSDDAGGTLEDAVMDELHRDTPPLPIVLTREPPAVEPARSSAPRIQTLVGIPAPPSSRSRKAALVLVEEPADVRDQTPATAEAKNEVRGPTPTPLDVDRNGEEYRNPFAGDAEPTGDAKVQPAAEALELTPSNEAAPFALTSRRSLPALPDDEPESTPPVPKSSISWGWVFLGTIPFMFAGVAWYVSSTQYFAPPPRPHLTAAPPLANAPRDAHEIYEPIPSGVSVNVDQGWLVLTTDKGAVVRADGAILEGGAKGVIATALASGRHVVQIELGDRASSWRVDVIAGQQVKVDLKPVP